MFFLTYGIIETGSVQTLLTNTRTNTQLHTSPGPQGALPKGISHCHSHKLLKTKLHFASPGLKKDHTASQDRKQINRQLTSKSSLTPEQMLGAKVRCWGGFFMSTFAWRVCGADKDAGQQELCFQGCTGCPGARPRWHMICV